MSYNGSGTFLINSTGQPVVAGTVISSSTFNALTTDLANGLSTAITKDGQTTITNNIPLNNFKVTNLGAGTVASDAARLDQVQSGATTTLTVTGTDTYVGTASPALAAYAAGNTFSFIVPNTNTGPATLNVSALGAKTITKNGTTALTAGDLTAGTVAIVIYDGTRFQLATAAAAGGSGSVTSVSVNAANGFTGTVATPTTTPAITISTNVTGIVKGNGTSLNAAISGVDYAPATSGSSILYGNGSGGFSNVTIGSGLTFAGGTLSSSGGGGGISGSGTTNYLSKFTASTAVGNSIVYDTGTAVGIGTTSPAKLLDVNGDALINFITIGRGSGGSSANTALGNSALSANTTGIYNTAAGYNALLSVTSGGSNTSVGADALHSNTSGSSNVGLGRNALFSNVSGSYNTAAGQGSLYSNTSNLNSAFGYNSLYSNTSGNCNLALANQSLYYNTSGSFNTAAGYQSLLSNTTGSQNVAVGYGVLSSNSTASNNVGVGSIALTYNTTGSYNSATGSYALYSNTTGYQNVSNGHSALQSNTVGYSNIGFGYQAMYSNIDGAENVGVGDGALYSSNGDLNVAVGAGALRQNTLGSNGTAIGAAALGNNTLGNYNVGLGSNAARLTTTGNYNTSLGSLSGYNISTGSGNVAVGGLNSIGSIAPAYVITTQSNYISMGSTSVTNAYIQVAWTVVSDARDKTNFGAVPYGLDFVSKLNPVSYQFKSSRDNDTPNGRVRYGFKAQDILALEGDSPVIIDADTPEKLYYNSDSMLPVLVNAIKELKAELDAVKSKIA